MWNGFINALKNAVSGWTAPKQSTQVKNVPSVTVNKPAPVYNAPAAVKSVSMPSVNLSKPGTSTPSPMQSSGIKVSLPSSSGISAPTSMANLTKPNLNGFQGLSAVAKLPGATTYQKQLADIINMAKGVGGLGLTAVNSNLANMYGVNALDSLRNLVGGAAGVAGSAINAPEFKVSEFLSAPVEGSANKLKPINTTQAKANETSGFNLTGGQWNGDTWVSNEELKRRQDEADQFSKTGQGEVDKLKLVNPQLEQLNNDYKSGKLSFDEYDTKVTALLNLGLGLNLGGGGLNTGTSTQSLTPSILADTYDKANLFATDPNKTGQSNVDQFNNEANSINDRIQNAVDQIIKKYNDGQMTIDQANAQIVEAQKRELYGARDRAVASANTDMGTIDKDTADYLAGVDTQMSRYKDEANQQKAQQGMTYDETLRRAVKNKALNEGNLRNVFAAAGTAESSDFQDRLMNLSQESGAEQSGIERAKGTTLAGIDKQVLNQLADSVANKDTFTRKQTDQKNAIMKSIQDLSGATEDKVFSLMADLATKIAAGKQNVGNQTAQLYNQLLANYSNQQNAGTLADQNKQLLMNNYTATNDINNIQSGTYQSGGGMIIKGYKRPQGAPQDLWDTVSQMMQSGVNAQAVMNQLKQQAAVNPAWAPWIGTMDTILGTNSKLANVA